jgi:hypothetical protein
MTLLIFFYFLFFFLFMVEKSIEFVGHVKSR